MSKERSLNLHLGHKDADLTLASKSIKKGLILWRNKCILLLMSVFTAWSSSRGQEHLPAISASLFSFRRPGVCWLEGRDIHIFPELLDLGTWVKRLCKYVPQMLCAICKVLDHQGTAGSSFLFNRLLTTHTGRLWISLPSKITCRLNVKMEGQKNKQSHFSSTF